MPSVSPRPVNVFLARFEAEAEEVFAGARAALRRRPGPGRLPVVAALVEDEKRRLKARLWSLRDLLVERRLVEAGAVSADALRRDARRLAAAAPLWASLTPDLDRTVLPPDLRLASDRASRLHARVVAAFAGGGGLPC